MNSLPAPLAFTFDAKRLAVAHSVARGLTTSDIAQHLSIPIRTIDSWKANPQFQAKVYELQLAMQGELVNAVADQILNALSYVIDVLHTKLPQLPIDTVSDVKALVDLAQRLAEVRANLIGKQQAFQPTALNQFNTQITNLASPGAKPPDIDAIIKRVDAAENAKAEIRDQFDLIMEEIAQAGQEPKGKPDEQ